MGTHMTNQLKCVGVYVAVLLYSIRSVSIIREILTGEKLQGVCLHPPLGTVCRLIPFMFFLWLLFMGFLDSKSMGGLIHCMVFLSVPFALFSIK